MATGDTGTQELPPVVDVTEDLLEVQWVNTFSEREEAGMQLVYAIYHSGADIVRSLPPQLIRAYLRASKAYGINGRN